MRKRMIGSAAAMAALLVLGYFSLDIYWIARGVICGEAFYAGKPTSYWRGVAQAKDPSPQLAPVIIPLPNTPTVPVTAPKPVWREKFDEWKRNWLKNSAARWKELEDDPDALPVLRELFDDKDEAIRGKAVSAICKHEAKASEYWQELADYLLRPSDDITYAGRLYLTLSLRKIGGAKAIPVLCNCLNASDQTIATCAHRVILEFGPEAEQALPHLTRNLDENFGYRSARLIAELNLGDRLTMLPVLAKAFQSDNAVVRRNAIWGVAVLADDPAAFALLIKGAKDPNSEVRRNAVQALGEMSMTFDGARAFACAHAIVRAYNNDPDPMVQAAACESFDDPKWMVGGERVLRYWLNAAEKEEHADLQFEAARALDKYLRSRK
jgi:HEAT repeat protein